MAPVSLKAAWGFSVLMGLAMNLSYAAAGELEPGRLSPVCELWGEALGETGISPYALFWASLLLGSFAVSLVTVLEGVGGFFSSTGGFLGTYTVLVGVMYGDTIYALLGAMMALAGLLVAAEADREKALREHRAAYL
ncbi:MAG: hypothetical protein QI199_00625 [Candidatus Korarchaeota archaeon]|nr:hypothetical protein [Candidatus Korarchaeota archaeon]